MSNYSQIVTVNGIETATEIIRASATNLQQLLTTIPNHAQLYQVNAYHFVVLIEGTDTLLMQLMANKFCEQWFEQAAMLL